MTGLPIVTVYHSTNVSLTDFHGVDASEVKKTHSDQINIYILVITNVVRTPEIPQPGAKSSTC